MVILAAVGLVLGLVVALLVWESTRGNPLPACGVYAQPGRWFYLKKVGMYLLLLVRRRQQAGRKGRRKLNGAGAGYGVRSRNHDSEMEQPQQLSAHEHALDAAYYMGVDQEGACVVMRVGRRHQRVCELWLCVNVPDVGVFQTPGLPDSRVCNTDGETFTAGGLAFHCLEPMRRWKVTFNGMLRKGLCLTWEDRDKVPLVYVKFSFSWEAFTEKFDFDTDMDPWLLADALAREHWTPAFWQRLKSLHQTHYEQWGEMRGRIKVEGQDEVKVCLRSLRDHSYGVRDWSTFHRYCIHLVHLQDGTVFHVSNISLPETTSYLRCGFLVRPCGAQHPVTWTDLSLPTLAEDGNIPSTYTFIFKAGGRPYHVEVSVNKVSHFYLQDWGTVIHERMCSYKVNGVTGAGIAEFSFRHEGACPAPRQPSVPALREPASVLPSDQSALTLAFTDPPCCSSALVGGKGCQLALLTQMDSKDFIVPPGFCLTIAAFNLQLKNNDKLQKGVSNLEAIASGRREGDVRGSCEDVVTMFEGVTLRAQIQRAINDHLHTLFPESLPSSTFAIRSSAAGEDSTDMSAAGQMDTILGVKGSAQIQDAVLKCWASHFAFQAVEYRRQHGQPISSTMGVVIQQMVKSEVSGVLFTRDPLTGNPSIMSVNANYGLGESVVSGSAEPDTIYLSRSWEDNVTILKKEIGGKHHQIRVRDAGGTEEMRVEEADATKCCLGDDVILRLAKIGIQLEQGFSDARDVEWAVYDRRIYLLQARPITTLSIEPDEDLMHEFDTPLVSDFECMTTTNIGEMMPGAMTPLTLSVFFRAIEYGFQDIQRNIGVLSEVRNLHKFLGLSQGKAFINMTYLHGICEGHVLGNEKRMADLALMGEVQEDLTSEMIVSYWGTSNFLNKLRHGINNFLNMRDSARRTKNWEDKMKTYTLCDHQRAAPLYQDICDHMGDLYQCWADTFTNSSRSGAWATILMAILSQGKTVWKTEYYSDVAMLLSKCDDVYSADVPTALQEMAVEIFQSGKKEEFIAMTPEEAGAWLQLPASGSVGYKFGNFLRNHGHRCVREADFYEKSWRAAPEKVVSVLQAMLRCPRPPGLDQRAAVSVKEAIKQIKSPTTFFGRCILHWALPRARKAVGSREWGKSISVQFNDIFKEAYWTLASHMVAEGYLPEEALLFFLTHQEIGQVLRERPGRLIAKAQRRKRILGKQMTQQFPRISWGHPQPIDDGQEPADVITSVKLKGMPVSQGHVRGIARVVLSLSEASLIKPGDVLVVHSTDVGWSPYFPLISGLVTEIGGLLSHGAVVAREYGLPCLVNVRRATRLVQSGDQVILDGFNGTLEKIKEM